MAQSLFGFHVGNAMLSRKVQFSLSKQIDSVYYCLRYENQLI